MELGAGLATDRDARTFGRFYDSLLTDGAWLRRRVETIHILDDRQLDRRISLDIDGRELRQRADRFGLRKLARLPVPLETLTKELQLDLDVKDAAGTVLPVTLSDEDSHLAHALLLFKIESNGIPLRSLTAGVREELFHLVRRPSTDRLFAIALRMITGDSSELERLCISLPVADEVCWGRLIDNDAIAESLIQISRNYVLATTLEPPSEAFVLKFRYVEDAPSSKQLGVSTQFGFRAAQFYVPAVGIGSAQREHLRVAVPDGARITRTRLRLDDQDLPTREYGLRQGTDRSVIYTTGRTKGDYGALVSIRPNLGYFFLPALLNVGFIAIILGFALFLELTSSRFTNHTEIAVAAVAIIALLPSATAIYFIRIGEHRLISRFHVFPRGLVLACAVSAVGVGAAVAVDVSHDHLVTLLEIALGLNAPVTIYLAAAVITIAAAGARSPESSFPRKY